MRRFFLSFVLIFCFVPTSYAYLSGYDYAGQVYSSITNGKPFYTKAPFYTEEGMQNVKVSCLFVKSVSSTFTGWYTGWLHNPYHPVLLDGTVHAVEDTPLPFVVTEDGLVLIGEDHWFTMSIAGDLVRSSRLSDTELTIIGPQILRRYE